MTYRSITSSILTASIAFSVAAPAFAATTDEILAEQKAFQATDYCGDKTGRSIGKCISDALKEIKQLRFDFAAALRADRKAWDKANSSLGVGAEHDKAFAIYSEGVVAKRKEFNDQQRAIEKLFFSKNTITRRNPPSVTPEVPKPSVQIDMEAAKLKCSVFKNEKTERVCIRQMVRQAQVEAKKTR